MLLCLMRNILCDKKTVVCELELKDIQSLEPTVAVLCVMNTSTWSEEWGIDDKNYAIPAITQVENIWM